MKYRPKDYLDDAFTIVAILLFCTLFYEAGQARIANGSPANCFILPCSAEVFPLKD